MVEIPGVDIPGPFGIGGGLGGFFGGLGVEASQAIVELVLNVIFDFIADAVAAVIGALALAFNSTSLQVNLRDGWFVGEGAEVTTITSLIAGSLVLVFLLMSLVRSMFAGEFSSMWRAALIDVPVAFLATALTVTVAAGLLAAVDEASVQLLGQDGAALSAFSGSLSEADQLGGAGLLGLLFGLLFIIGAVLIWIQLLVRSALIYLVVAFAPITWVTRAYPGTRHVAKRGAEIGVALIVSKFVMAVSFRVGAAAMAASNAEVEGDVNLSAMLIGAAVMLMTAFMPWMVFKAIPMAEAATVAAGAERAAVATAVVGGGLAFAGLSRLAGAGGSAVGRIANSGAESNSPDGGGDGGNGGADTGSGAGGGGTGGAAAAGAGAAAVVATRAREATIAGAGAAMEGVDDVAAPTEGASTSTSASRGSSHGASPAGGASAGVGGLAGGGGGSSPGGGPFPSTPVGGSPGVHVVEVEPLAPETPARPPDAGLGSGPQPLTRVRTRAEP